MQKTIKNYYYLFPIAIKENTKENYILWLNFGFNLISFFNDEACSKLWGRNSNLFTEHNNKVYDGKCSTSVNQFVLWKS